MTRVHDDLRGPRAEDEPSPLDVDVGLLRLQGGVLAVVDRHHGDGYVTDLGARIPSGMLDGQVVAPFDVGRGVAFQELDEIGRRMQEGARDIYEHDAGDRVAMVRGEPGRDVTTAGRGDEDVGTGDLGRGEQMVEVPCEVVQT